MDIDQIEDDVSNSFSSLVSTAAPAVIAGAENYAAQQLSQSAQATQAQATARAAAAPPATGIFASIENSFTQTAAGAWLTNNWKPVVGGVAALALVFFIARK